MSEEVKIHRDLDAKVEGPAIINCLLTTEIGKAHKEDISKEVHLLGRLIGLHHAHLVAFPGQLMPKAYITKHNAARVFLRNYHRYAWHGSIQNRSPMDLLFVATCYARAATMPVDKWKAVMPQNDNLQQMLADVLELGRAWHNLSAISMPDPDGLFLRCAAFVVCIYGRQDGIRHAMELCESKMIEPDGSHPSLSTDQRVRVPVTVEESIKMERDKHNVAAEQAAARDQNVSIIASSFIGSCSRVFLHIWADDYIIRKEAKTDNKQFDASAADAERKGGKLHEWMKVGLQHTSAEFSAKWRMMPFRAALALGAIPYNRRLPGKKDVSVGPDELYRAEAGDELLAIVQKQSTMKVADIAADLKHPLYNTLLVSYYAHRFKLEFPNYDFFENLFVLNDRVPEKLALIRSIKTLEKKPRPPLGVQMRGEYFLHHAGTWIPFGIHLEALLLKQLAIICSEQGGKLPTGESVSHSWSKQFQ